MFDNINEILQIVRLQTDEASNLIQWISSGIDTVVNMVKCCSSKRSRLQEMRDFLNTIDLPKYSRETESERDVGETRKVQYAGNISDGGRTCWEQVFSFRFSSFEQKKNRNEAECGRQRSWVTVPNPPSTSPRGRVLLNICPGSCFS